MELPSTDSGNTVNGTVSTAFDIKFGVSASMEIGIW